MQGHRPRQATKRCSATPVRPKGYGGAGSSTVLALLDYVQTLPASRRLVSDPAAPVTRPHLLLGQAPQSPPLFPKGPPVLINEESAEVLYIFLLFRECELALAELAVFEVNGNFLNAMQVTLNHQL